MRILYVANARIPTEKAHGTAIMRACDAFVKAGADVTLVVARRLNPIHDEAHTFYGIANHFPIVRLPVVDLPFLPFLPRLLWFAVESVSFQVSLFAWALFRSRKTLIYTRSITAVLLRFLGFRVLYEMHTRPRRAFFLHWLARHATGVVVISGGLKDDLMRAGVTPARILVAPSGVDPSVFDIDMTKEAARRELRLPLDAHLAVYTGNFTTMGADKGLSDSIHALKSASDVTLLAVGGSKKDIERYSREARAAGVSGRVFLYGYAPQNILAKYQKAADVLIMPFPDTPHYRNHMSPVKMFEYMASGRPIIASDLPTIREVLNDTNSYIVPPGEPAELARTMTHTLKDREESAARASRARRDVQAYAWDARAKYILTRAST